MARDHDPLDSFFKSLHAVETEIRRATRGIESRLFRPSKDAAGPHFVPLKKKTGSGDAAVAPIKSSRGEERDAEGSVRPCSICFRLAAAWSVFVQALPEPFKSVRTCFHAQCRQKDVNLEDGYVDKKCDVLFGGGSKGTGHKKFELLSVDLLLYCVMSNLAKKFTNFRGNGMDSLEKSADPATSAYPFLMGITKGKKFGAGLFSNMGFARVGGDPGSMVEVTSSDHDERQGTAHEGIDIVEEQDTSAAQKLRGGLLNIPLPTVERLRTTLSSVSFTELVEFIPQLGRSSSEHPDKKKLFSVQDFFRYTESEGKRFFEELDRDGDGQVTLEDLEVAMRKRKLPRRYARNVFRRTRRHLFSKSFGLKQFLSLIKQKDPTILRAYTSLCLSKSGTLQKNQILVSLESAGLPAHEENAVAMMRYLDADGGGSISYSHFRNFMLLLPSERLKEDPRSIWFEAATVVAVPPPVEIPAESVLKSALAGGLASALSTSMLFPLDTIKTRVQISTFSFPEVISTIPQIGLQGLYRGSIPAVIGQFSSHGLRTGIFEASKLVLINVAPTLPDIQVQSIASFCSTFLGTAVRIPCEVLKQRLQAGIFDNVGEAIVGTLRQDGIRGFFRGTGATLCREVPLYVAGMGLYAETKKAAQNFLGRELEPWEAISVGAVSGGLAAVVTTPFDVLKTRMMTAPPGLPVSMPTIVISILRHEGPLGLFKGAVPRFFWIAPLGAMNFAGYELAKKAMDRPDEADLLSENTKSASD